MLLDIDKLSSGCKTVLNVLYYPDKVFCMKECGNNALEMLYGLEGGCVYSDYAYPKNPVISKIFREIGYADELGSGMRNSYKYTRLYSGAEPEFIEGDVFKIIIPLSIGAMIKVGPELNLDHSYDEKVPKNDAEKSSGKEFRKKVPKKSAEKNAEKNGRTI